MSLVVVHFSLIQLKRRGGTFNPATDLLNQTKSLTGLLNSMWRPATVMRSNLRCLILIPAVFLLNSCCDLKSVSYLLIGCDEFGRQLLPQRLQLLPEQRLLLLQRKALALKLLLQLLPRCTHTHTLLCQAKENPHQQLPAPHPIINTYWKLHKISSALMQLLKHLWPRFLYQLSFHSQWGVGPVIL